MSRRNELIRRLLSGLTDSELENLVRVREEARYIPAPRDREKHALFLHLEDQCQPQEKWELSN